MAGNGTQQTIFPLEQAETSQLDVSFVPPPKPGNAFAQKKEMQTARHRLLQHSSSYPSEPGSYTPAAMSRSVSADSADIVIGASTEIVKDLPPTPNTTMDMFTKMELALPMPKSHSEAHNGKMSKRSITDPRSAQPAPSHPSALPLPLFHEDRKAPAVGLRKAKIAQKPSKYLASIRSPAPPTTSEKALEILAGRGKGASTSSHARYGSSSSIPDPYRISSGSESSTIGHATPAPVPTRRWLLENKKHMALPGSTSDTSFETPQNDYVITKAKADAMIMGDSSLSPTRQGSYAISSRVEVVHSRPSVVSMIGSFSEVSPKSDSHLTCIRHSNELLQPMVYESTDPVEQSSRPSSDESQKTIYTPSVYNVPGAGAWETLQTQHPTTLPEFQISPTEPNQRASTLSEGIDKVLLSPSIASAGDEKGEARRDNNLNEPEGSKNAETDKSIITATTPRDSTMTKSERKTAQRRAACNSLDSMPSPIMDKVAGADKKELHSKQDATSPITRSEPEVRYPMAAQVGSANKRYSSTARAPQNHVDAAEEQAPGRYESVTTSGGYCPTPQMPGYRAEGTIGEHITYGFQTAHYHLDHEAARLHNHIQTCVDRAVDAFEQRSDQILEAQIQHHDRMHSKLSRMYNKINEEVANTLKLRNDMIVLQRQQEELMADVHRETGRASNRLHAVNDRISGFTNRMDRLEVKVDELLVASKVAPANDIACPTSKGTFRKGTPLPAAEVPPSISVKTLSAMDTCLEPIRSTMGSVNNAHPTRPRANTPLLDSNEETNFRPNPKNSPSAKKKPAFFHKKSQSSDLKLEDISIHPALRHQKKDSIGSTTSPTRSGSEENRFGHQAPNVGRKSMNEDDQAQKTLVWPRIGSNPVGWSGGNWYHHEDVTGEMEPE